MLFINDEFYGRRRMERFWQTLEDDAVFQKQVQQPLAVCLADTAEWLMLLLYLHRRRLSVLPIDASVPLAQAKQLARRAGCARLLYGQRQTAIEIAADHTAPPASLLQLSSGTTGEPKVIARHWDDIDTEIRSYINFFRQPETMTPLIACPVTHAYGLICGVLVALARGTTPVIVTRLQASVVVKQLLKTHHPLVYASPFLLDGVVQLLPATVQLHALMTSGSVLPVPVFERLRGRVEHFFQQYGCSETGCISINPEVRDPAQIGRVLPHLQLDMTVPENGRVTPEEIVVITADGRRVATRDLGLLDQQQRLTYLSRLDDTIVVAGKNVYPQQVETTVLACEGVIDAVAFGVSDELAGQRVALQVCVTDGVDANAVERWCHQQLAPFQRPHHLQIVPHISRLANGKISRRQLSAHLQPHLRTPVERQEGALL